VRGSRRSRLPGKANIDLKAGDRIRIETPGGGGWGPR
jgi:N-methylhydantoinase B